MTVVNWKKKKEPWRSIGMSFCQELRGICDAVISREPTPVNRPDLLSGDTADQESPGGRIVAMRLSRGWSMRGLSDVSGLSLHTIRSAQRSEGTVSKSSREAIARAFGISENEIWPLT
jgi:lambda repressor-like predicted transcriptional regulator